VNYPLSFFSWHFHDLISDGPGRFIFKNKKTFEKPNWEFLGLDLGISGLGAR